MKMTLPVSQETLTGVARLDRFQGRWSAEQHLPHERLVSLREATAIQSTGASCRLAGIRVTDAEVADLLRGGVVLLREAGEIRGYAVALAHSPAGSNGVLDTLALRRLHAVALGAPSIDDHDPLPSDWRQRPLYPEAFDAQGRATGQVFSTLPPHLVEEKTDELLTWLELELRSGEQHPVLVVGAFVLGFLAASPFDRGNGRLARLLTSQLLRRAGYSYLPYASIESQMEGLRESYYTAVSLAQTRLWTDEANPAPWLDFFLQVLDRHRARVEAKLQLERQAWDYPPLQRLILETVRDHGNVDASLLIKATGASRNTLKDNLRRLVVQGVLEKTGQRRGTRYRLTTGARPAQRAGEAFEH